MDENPRPSSCILCSSFAEDKKLVVASLIRRLQKQFNILNKKGEQIEFYEDRQGFRQILKVLNLIEAKTQSSSCLHEKLQSYLMNKLKCSKQALNFVCQRLAFDVGQRNYHLELVRHQIKNVSESINEGKIQYQINDITEKAKSLRRSKAIASKKPIKVKIQNAFKIQSQPKIENSPQPEALQPMNSFELFPMIQPDQNIKIEQPEQNIGLSFYFPTFPYFYSRNQ